MWLKRVGCVSDVHVTPLFKLCKCRLNRCSTFPTIDSGVSATFIKKKKKNTPKNFVNSRYKWILLDTKKKTKNVSSFYTNCALENRLKIVQRNFLNAMSFQDMGNHGSPQLPFNSCDLPCLLEKDSEVISIVFSMVWIQTSPSKHAVTQSSVNSAI